MRPNTHSWRRRVPVERNGKCPLTQEDKQCHGCGCVDCNTPPLRQPDSDRYICSFSTLTDSNVSTGFNGKEIPQQLPASAGSKQRQRHLRGRRGGTLKAALPTVAAPPPPPCAFYGFSHALPPLLLSLVSQIHPRSARGLGEQVFAAGGVLFCVCECALAACIHASVCAC